MRSRLTFCLGAAAVAFVLLKKAACGVARIGAGLAAAVLLRSLAPAKRDCRLIFMLRAVIVDAMANGSGDAGRGCTQRMIAKCVLKNCGKYICLVRSPSDVAG